MSPDEQLLAAMRTMWERTDPCPPDLAERVLFRLGLEQPDVELMVFQSALTGAGARTTEVTDTVIFESQRLALTITVSDGRLRQRRRVDGWISPSAALRVCLHGAQGVLEETADEDGRFAFVDVAGGFVHFTVEPTAGAAVRLDHPVATPAISI
ncbi:hypothetical protein ACFO1B_18880 [Dactylosporangium siamense]|uniref:Carboxypeptidase regulatory-like domain-containing protein n=1 Tax=Dactylosporangium siamense TaxID=685454 RepID=A0A919U615_9ACTN|nr:hypothetical protein [Dactylosporangium siamense]GIG43944.1 hypothetical protein Dsi01nite_019850 [Dactylosporangium siamense]